MANDKIYLVTIEYEIDLAAFPDEAEANRVADGYSNSFVTEINFFPNRKAFDVSEGIILDDSEYE